MIFNCALRLLLGNGSSQFWSWGGYWDEQRENGKGGESSDVPLALVTDSVSTVLLLREASGRVVEVARPLEVDGAGDKDWCGAGGEVEVARMAGFWAAFWGDVALVDGPRKSPRWAESTTTKVKIKRMKMAIKRRRTDDFKAPVHIGKTLHADVSWFKLYMRECALSDELIDDDVGSFGKRNSGFVLIFTCGDEVCLGGE